MAVTIRLRPTGWVPGDPVLRSITGTAAGSSSDAATARRRVGISGTASGTSSGSATAQLRTRLTGTASGTSSDSGTVSGVSDEPIYNAATDTLLFADDFDSYGSTSDMLFANGGPYNPVTSGVSLDTTTVSGAGGGSMRVDFTHNNNCQDVDQLVEVVGGFPNSNVDTVVMQYDARYDADFAFTGGSSGSCPGGAGAKEWIFMRGGDGSGRVAVQQASQPMAWSDASGNETNVDSDYGTNFTFGWDVTINGTGGGTAYKIIAHQHLNIATHNPNQMRGDWFRYTLLIRRETSAAAGDGRVAMWIDGTPVIDLDGTVPGHAMYQHMYTKTNSWLQAHWPSVVNRGVPHDQSRWFDNIVIFSPAGS